MATSNRNSLMPRSSHQINHPAPPTDTTLAILGVVVIVLLVVAAGMYFYSNPLTARATPEAQMVAPTPTNASTDVTYSPRHQPADITDVKTGTTTSRNQSP